MTRCNARASMKLIELKPRWYVAHYWIDGMEYPPNHPSERNGMGISFECPHCRTGRLGVDFANPIDGGPAAAPRIYTKKDGTQGITLHWQREGDSFETISIRPSMDFSDVGHWHGFITNGEVT